jgi:uncharacterized RDD family membrane protein YckC
LLVITYNLLLQVQQILAAISTLDMSESVFLSASLWRRLAAMVYDGLLLFAVMVVAFLPTLLFTHGLQGPSGKFKIIVQFYLFSVIYVYLGWLWTHGGQTLGMRAWKIKLVQRDGTPVTWLLGLFYYVISLPMWGFLIFTIAVNASMIPTPALLAHTPHWLLYGLSLTWFVIDHLPNNWRERLAKLRMVELA